MTPVMAATIEQCKSEETLLICTENLGREAEVSAFELAQGALRELDKSTIRTSRYLDWAEDGVAKLTVRRLDSGDL